jgi:hypothetical protein
MSLLGTVSCLQEEEERVRLTRIAEDVCPLDSSCWSHIQTAEEEAKPARPRSSRTSIIITTESEEKEAAPAVSRLLLFFSILMTLEAGRR